MSAWTRALVAVSQQSAWRASRRVVRNEKGTGGSSPCCGAQAA